MAIIDSAASIKVKTTMTGIDFQVQMIRQKAAGRALAIIGNDSRLENALRGSDLCISAYITRDSEKSNGNSKLKPISFLTGKREEYFLIILDKQENEMDISVFDNMGYRNNEDIFWSIHKPVEADKGGVPDIYGNVCVNKSAGKIFFTGYGANVDIGVNAKIPKNGIFVGSECKIFIGDDSDIEGWNLRCKSGNTLEIGKKVFGGTGNVFFYGNDATIKLEGGCRLNNPIIIKSFANSLIQIGSESSFGPGCQFWAHVSSCIKVGEKCLASNNITMIAGDGHSIFNEESGERINPVDIPGKNSIIIGNHCWLGFGAFFLSGEIKNSSIVGAGSLVKGRFPNNVIVAGNPATIIKENVTWTRNPLVKGIGACEEEYIQLTQYSEKTKQKTLDKERWYQEQLSRLEDVIEKQNKDVQQAEIQKHEEKESLINKLNSLEKENQALQKKVSEIKVSVNAQNESLSKSYELNAELKNQLLEKEALVVQMQSSFSWKITYPLRKIRYWQLNHQKKHR